MGKKTTSKKPESVGHGNVTPVQIAFIVDRYLSDNNYSTTRSAFHSEANSLISKFSVKEAPKSVLSLGAILDEYISLKGQRVFVDQERVRLERENLRIQNLLKGMHDAMSAFNASSNASPALLPSSSVPTSSPMVTQGDLNGAQIKGYYPMYNAPAVMPTSAPSTYHTDPANFTTPIINQTNSKRKGSKDVADVPLIAKRTRRSLNSSQLPPKGSVSNSIQGTSTFQQSANHDNALSGSPVQGSGVAKCLFNPSNSSSPKTPPRASSSQTEKSVTPVEVCSTLSSSKDITPPQFTSINSTITSSQMICISPAKQIAYCSIERNHSISMSSPAKTSLTRPNPRDNVKGRLNFDTSDKPMSLEQPVADGIPTSESDLEGDIFDLDLANLDAFGADFNLSELLLDFDLQSDGIGCSGQLAADSSPDSFSESAHTSENFNICADQVVSQCSTMTEVQSEKDMDMPAPDTVTTIKSITKCIKILSPVKSQRSMHQVNSSALGQG